MEKVLEQYSDPKQTWSEVANGQSMPDDRPPFTYTTDKHFTSQRTALLFAPGAYPVDFEVGYYSSVIGLGVHPTDVAFVNCTQGPHVPALEKYTNRPPHGSGLDTFWRSVENVAVAASEGMRWTVSQAAPLRRVHVRGDLLLSEGDAWVSGGVAANCVVDGTVDFGGQQQWLMRNVHVGTEAKNGAWSLVFVGCTGNVPAENKGLAGGPAISVENDDLVRIEKPYIALQPNGRLQLLVPAATFGQNAVGPQHNGLKDDIRDFARVKLGVPCDATDAAAAARDNHATLQRALDEGKDVVLSPGIYPLADSLEVKFDRQVILGLGYATLIAPQIGKPCILIRPRLAGVRVAGVMLEASLQHERAGIHPSCLLQWGLPTVSDPGDPRNPGALSDVFTRVGGNERRVSTDVMVHLYSGNVFGDNLWLWRADHVALEPNELANFEEISTQYRQTVRGECVVRNGLVVHEGATNVTMVGLAVEHATEDQTVWRGEKGRVFFYQCELPYDVDASFAENDFVGYRVGEQVRDHRAAGVGVYSNFRDFNVRSRAAVAHPEGENGIVLRNLFTVKLDNRGEISSVVNGKGPGPTPATPPGTPLRCEDERCDTAV